MKKKPTNKRPATLADLRGAASAGKPVSGIFYRAAELGNIDVEKRTVELAFSSETPVERWGFVEVLDHGKESVDMAWISSGRGPLLADHNMSVQIGVIESAEIDSDRIGRAVVRFGKRGQADDYFQDVVDGIRTNISVGYSVDHVILEEETEGAATYRVMKWTPLEISLVSIPADQTVGIGRSDDAEGEDIIPEQTPKPKEKRTMKPKQKVNKRADDEEEIDREEEETEEERAEDDAEADKKDERKKEVTRIREIQALGIRHGFQDDAQKYIQSGKSVSAFRAHVLNSIDTDKPVTTARSETGGIGLTDKEARNYSFVKIFRYLADPTNKRFYDDCAFERECSEAVGSKFNGRKFRGNIQIPSEVLTAARGMQQRDLNTGTGSAGGYLVDTDLRTGSFIELLRNKMMVRQLGAQVLGGLEGNVSIPKQTGGATAYWVTEGGTVTESQQTIGQVALTPKTVGAFTELTRRFLMQSSLDAELFVRNDLATTLALAIDKAALKGSGSGGEPLGILNTSGIGSVTITTHTFTHGKMIDLESELAADNADLGSLAYLANPKDRGRMKQTVIDVGSGRFIWSNVQGQPGVGEVNGYYAYASNQLAEDEVIFGNWADLVIGEWGVLDVLVNPYALDTSGGVRITALQDVDVAVRHPESFARTTV